MTKYFIGLISFLFAFTVLADSLSTATVQIQSEQAGTLPTVEEAWFIDEIGTDMDAVGPPPPNASVVVIRDPRKPYGKYPNWASYVNDVLRIPCYPGGPYNWYTGCVRGATKGSLIYILYLEPSIQREINASIPPQDADKITNPCRYTWQWFGKLYLHEAAHMLGYEHGDAMTAYEQTVINEFAADQAMVQAIDAWDKNRLQQQGC